MTAEDRLKEILSRAARDPAPQGDWSGFLKRARRDRLVHRARVAGGVALVAVVAAVAGSMLDDVPERSDPRPAEKEERQDDGETRRDDLPDLERRVSESRERVEDAGLVPGPGQPAPEGRPRPGRGDGPAHGPAGDRPGPVAVEGDPAMPRCRGEEATIAGTPGDDTIEGTSGRDVIAGLGGDDSIRGGAGGDFLCGGDGIDHVSGEDGGDSLLGGRGDDSLDGGDGFDFVHFPTAPNGITLDFGRNRAEGDGTDLLRDLEAAEGTPSGDDFVGDGKANLFWGGGGPDFFNTGGGGDEIWPGPGDDGVNGAGGSDTVGFLHAGGSSRQGVDVDLSGDRAVGEGVDLIGFVENVYGTTGNDVISGNEDTNVLNGGFGDDTISGAAGDDRISGAAGRDALEGGPGHDALDGGADHDTCTSGEERTSCETTDPITGAAALLALGALARVAARLSRRRGHRSAWG